MTTTLRHGAIIVAVAVVVLFTNLGGPRLWDRDEPRNAGCTAEMLARGDLITPVFDGELRTHKPILLYWFMMVAYSLFGISEFSARFWSAAMGMGTALLTYGIGRRLLAPAVGLWAAVILVTTLMFDVASRAATPDSQLIFWTTAAIWVYVRSTFPAVAVGDWSAGPNRLLPTWPQSIVMYAMMGMAVLAKGPVGLVLPTAVIGMYLLIQRLPSAHQGKTLAGGGWFGLMRTLASPFGPRHFLGTCWRMRPLTALTVVCLVALPWYVAVALRTDGEWVTGFLLDHNLGRAAQALEGHKGFVLFYPLALLVGFFPWSVFAAPTVMETWHSLRGRDRHSAGLILALCWMGVFIGLFSMARTKLPSYITPCYPAVALLVGHFIVRWTRNSASSAWYWPPAALACLALVGLGIAIAVPIAATRFVPGEEWLALLGCIPMLTASAAWGFTRARLPARAAVAFAVGAMLFTTGLFAVGAARVDSHRTFDQFVAHAYRQSPQPQIGTLGVLEPSWVFYTGQPMDHLFAPELTPNVAPDAPLLGTPRTKDWQFKPSYNVWRYLREGTQRYVITTTSQLKQLGKLPDDVEIIANSAYFLQDEELVLLARRRSSSGTTTRVAESPDTPDSPHLR